MRAQKALASSGNGVRLAIHDAHVKRPLLERCQHVLDETRVAHAMIQADLVTIWAERLLIALLGVTFFVLGNHFQVLAKLTGQTRYLVLGVRALTKDGGGIDKLVCAFALW